MTNARTPRRRFDAAQARARLNRVATLPVILVAIIILLICVIVIQALKSPEIKALGLLSGSTATPTEAAPKTYHNGLYYFQVEPDDYVASLKRSEDVADCRGIVFWDDPRGPLYRDEAARQIRICYVADVTEETEATLRKALETRAELIQGHLIGAKVGTVRLCDVGRSDLTCIERHLQGANELASSGVEWYQAIVSHGRRLYAVEATCNTDNWAEHESAAQRLLSTLRFDEGVMPP